MKIGNNREAIFHNFSFSSLTINIISIVFSLHLFAIFSLGVVATADDDIKATKLVGPTGISSLVRHFLFKTSPGRYTNTYFNPNPSGTRVNHVGGFWNRRRIDDLGDAGVAEGEEAGGLRCERVRKRVSCGEERVEALLQKNNDDGENTRELQTTTEQDIVLLLYPKEGQNQQSNK